MGSAGGQILFFIVIVAIFWFLLVRPQQQRAKQHADLVAGLKPGDEVVTAGGIYGTVVELKDDRVRVRVSEGVEIEFARGAVASVVTPARTSESSDADEDVHV